jgi:hypothetical protein
MDKAEGCVQGLFGMMDDLLKTTEDTVWLHDHETVFARCWMIVEQQEGRERLEKRYPEYS